MNLDVFFKSKITAEEFILLSVIQQNSGGNQKEKLEEINDDYKSLEDKGFVKFVKAKNKTQSIHELIRLDKKGSKLLVDLFTYSPEEDTEKIISWIETTYKSMGKFIKNRKEACRRCEFFSKSTGIEKNKLAFLLQTFMQNVYNPDIHGDNFREAKKQNPNLVLSNQVENIFWTPKDIFSKHYSLDNSPLYTFYLDNEEFFNTHFKKYEA